MSMSNVWSALSTHRLQAYPSRMQMLFSQRKDKVPKRCLPDNNLEQEGLIALLLALCQEIRPAVLNESSLDKSKQNSTYTYWLFFGAHPVMP